MPRALAWAIDLVLRATVVMAVLMVAGYLGRAGSGLALLTLFIVEWLAPAWFEVYWRGQTPGKRALGIAVVNDDGTPVRWGAALTRNLLRAVDFLPFLYGFGLAAMLASRDFKRLGDLAAGTVVVYAPGRARARALPEAKAEPPPFALSLDEQRVVLDLAERS
ncbi:MAG: RDD family protein, partial [Burkholderiales bacterium]